MLLDNTDLFVRGAERLLIDLGGIFFGYLGFRLFTIKVDAGPQRIEFHSPIAKMIVSGKAPGLFFMAFGALILIVSLLHGGSEYDVHVSPASASQGPAVASGQIAASDPTAASGQPSASEPIAGVDWKAWPKWAKSPATPPPAGIDVHGKVFDKAPADSQQMLKQQALKGP